MNTKTKTAHTALGETLGSILEALKALERANEGLKALEASEDLTCSHLIGEAFSIAHLANHFADEVGMCVEDAKEVKEDQKPAKRERVCHSIPEFGLSLIQVRRDNFTVKYGLQVKDYLNYSRAALEYGACLMHALACEGKLDNREIGER